MLKEILFGYMIAWFIGFGVFALEALFVAGINLAIKKLGVTRIPLFLFGLYCHLGSTSFLGTVIRGFTAKHDDKNVNFLIRALFYIIFIPIVLLLPVMCVLYFGRLIYECVYRYIYGKGEVKNVAA